MNLGGNPNIHSIAKYIYENLRGIFFFLILCGFNASPYPGKDTKSDVWFMFLCLKVCFLMLRNIPGVSDFHIFGISISPEREGFPEDKQSCV